MCVAYVPVVHTKCGNFDLVGHYIQMRWMVEIVLESELSKWRPAS